MNAPLVYGILLGAGSGSRLNVPVPKAFVEYQGVTILRRSFDTLRHSNLFSEIIVTVPKELLSHDECHSLRSDGAHIIAGGETRQHSVQRALQALKPHAQDSDYVLIHDAARCFVTSEILERTVSNVRTHGAVTTGMPSVDSVKRIDDAGFVEQSLTRDKLWSVQTPQAFRFDHIWRAHQEFVGQATDDASMVEPFMRVKMILGGVFNKKITVQEDLA